MPTEPQSPIERKETEQNLPFPVEDRGKTPECVKNHVLNLCQKISDLQRAMAGLHAQDEELKARLNQNSSNSNRPPSTDSPYQKGTGEPKNKGKAGGKKGRKGHRQRLLTATETLGFIGTTSFKGVPMHLGVRSYGDFRDRILD